MQKGVQKMRYAKMRYAKKSMQKRYAKKGSCAKWYAKKSGCMGEKIDFEGPGAVFTRFCIKRGYGT
jgi:hypothetical protein